MCWTFATGARFSCYCLTLGISPMTSKFCTKTSLSTGSYMPAITAYFASQIDVQLTAGQAAIQCASKQLACIARSSDLLQPAGFSPSNHMLLLAYFAEPLMK